MARVYSNENVPLPAVLELRSRGHDVLTSYDAGRANRQVSETDVLAFAHEDSRVVLTNNRKDFIALHRAGVAHSGIVVFTTDVDFCGVGCEDRCGAVGAGGYGAIPCAGYEVWA